jgi:hypothetical protein
MYTVLVQLWNKEMGDCFGTYLGCAACEFAGPMEVTKTKPSA